MRTRTTITEEQKQRWHADPANWKLWGCYYNPEDPRWFPPKRSWLGWTMNFANPVSVAMMMVLCVALLIVVGLFR